MTRPRSSLALAGIFAVLLCATGPTRCAAITIVIDYSKDTNNFFPVGSQARAAIEATASFYSGILADTFSAIVEPANLQSSLGGLATWDWTMSYPNPSTGVTVAAVPPPSFAVDEYRIFVGGRALSDSTLGIGGPGSRGYSFSQNGSFTAAENMQVQQTTANWISAVGKRGQSTGFADWGGAISFDNEATTVWHFNHLTAPPANTNDFYSVAIHEMGHALGLGTSDEWSNLATGANFSGAAATAAYGGPPPLRPFAVEEPSPKHWASGTMSRVLGTNIVQEAAMDPELTHGTRKLLTTLDAAALTDIGWIVNSPTFDAADFNRDHIVNGSDLTTWKTAFKVTAAGDADGDGDSDGADFLIWQRQFGRTTSVDAIGAGVPEPSSAALAVFGVVLFVLCARLRRQFYAASSGRVWAA